MKIAIAVIISVAVSTIIESMLFSKRLLNATITSDGKKINVFVKEK